MSEPTYDVTCPHCHKEFEAELIEGDAARYRGFKCPHCKLFVPADRAEEIEPSRLSGSEPLTRLFP